MRTQSTPIDRFFNILVEEIRDSQPAYEEGSFTVAEIYQSLIPYRTHRDRLGVEMNGDYEDALLRLLGGEGGYLELESDTARERIRLELRSSNPNTGLYREYAAVGVHLNPEKLPERSSAGKSGSVPELALDGLGGDDMAPPEHQIEAPKTNGGGGKSAGEDGDDSPAPAPPVRPGRSEVVLSAAPLEVPAAASSREAPDGKAGEGAVPAGSSSGETPPEVCPECASDLPGRDGLRFCPFCGANVFVMPCTQCGEVLERNWSFCISCGESAA
jgi:hypothetical protein